MRQRITRQPLTERELNQPGPPIRLSDLVSITGWSKDTLIAAIDSGHLPAIRATHRPKAPYYLHRAEVLAWMARIGWSRSTFHKTSQVSTVG